MKLIMFDMDGTLYRTETSFFPAVQEFSARHAFPSPDEEFLRRFIGQNAGGAWRTWIDRLQLDQPTDELMQEFDLLEKRLVQERGQLYPGAAKTLQGIAAEGWTLGICSNAPAWYPEVILTGAGVRDLFAQIRVPRRPDETKAMMLCEVWNELHPERCAMVGDRADDMQAARAGGFTAIGAVYGWAPDELGQADLRIHDITELPAALARLAAAATPQIPVETAAAPEKPSEPAPAATPRTAPVAVPEPTVKAPVPPEAVHATQPVAEPAVTQEPGKAPEPVPQPPVTPKPVEPVQPLPEAIQRPVPPTAPRPAPPAPEPPQQPEPAPAARRPWSLFRRRDDRSR
jgi:phosphoglycolate phosphatase